MLRKSIFKFLKKLKDPTLYMLNEFGFKDEELAKDEPISVSNLNMDQYLEEDDEALEEKYVEPLSEVHEFLSEYIGLTIYDYSSFDNDIVSASDLSAKIISSVKLEKYEEQNSIRLSLTGLTGIPYADVFLIPTSTGQFVEKTEADAPAFSARYRFTFAGGNYIEYHDYKDSGKIIILRKK